MHEHPTEKTLRMILRQSRKGAQPAGHPDEQTLGAFALGTLSQKDAAGVRAHLISCARCAECVALALCVPVESDEAVPAGLLERVRTSACAAEKSAFLEIVLKLKEKAIELLSSSGDVLTGQELVPAPVLRSRQKQEFGDSVTVLKNFKDVRVEARVERCEGSAVNLSVNARCISTQACLKEARMTLLKDSLELESYLAQSGTARFENLSAGLYSVDISSSRQALALIVLDLRT